jgi:Hemerythrin HHE cation binding domain
MTTSSTASSAGPEDAIVSLVADHKRVKTLFEEFEKVRDEGDAEDQKAQLVAQICLELTMHTALEEEVFYPAVRAKIDDEDLMDEALVEHASAKELIEDLESMDPTDDLYDAKVTVLGEQIDHHVEEEESDMFPKARQAKVNTPELAREMEQRREELSAELGDDDEDDDVEDDDSADDEDEDEDGEDEEEGDEQE